MTYLGVFAGLGITTPTLPGEGDGLVSVNKPLQVSVMDPLAGSALGAMTVRIYDGSMLVETLTTAATGLATSSQPYQSGKVLNVHIVGNTTYAGRWTTVTIPKMNAADAQSLTTNYVLLSTRAIGTFEFRAVRDDTGAAVTNGTAINMTSFTTTPLKLTFTVANTADNTGWISSYDPISKVNLNAVTVISSGQSYMTVQNAGSYVSRGTTSNWLTTMNDDLITKQLVGSTYTKPGSQTFTVTVYAGSLTSAANQTVTLNLYKNFDTQYFSAQGVGGPDAATIATQMYLEFYTA